MTFHKFSELCDAVGIWVVLVVVFVVVPILFQ